MFKGFGIGHVRLGVRNLDKAMEFYRKYLGFNKVLAVFPEGEYNLPGLYRISPIKFKGCMLQQQAGGARVELGQMIYPAARPIRMVNRYEDIGVAKMTITVEDVMQLHEELRSKGNFCTRPQSVTVSEWGDYHFIFTRDLEGNLIELISGPPFKVEDKFGGVRWIGISVSDLERSKAFYEKYLGFDTVVVNPHSRFSGKVDEVSGGNETDLHSCIISNSRGGAMLELLEFMRPRGRSMPLGTLWGDFGYLGVSLECEGIHGVAEFYEKEGLDFLCPLTGIVREHDEVWFLFVRDPDGIAVENTCIISKG